MFGVPMTACSVCRARVRARADGTAGRHTPDLARVYQCCPGTGYPTIEIAPTVGAGGRPPVGPVALSERVTVLLSPDEVALMDGARGDWSRSDWLARESGLRS